MSKSSFIEEQQWYYLSHNWQNKGAYTFLKDISLKMNVIARLEFELINKDVAV